MTVSICVATEVLAHFCSSVYVLGFPLYDTFICCLAYRMNDSSLWPINLHNYLRSLHRSQARWPPSFCMEPSSIMSEAYVPMNKPSNMTDHPFISTSHRSDTLKMMLYMRAFLNWCDFSSAEGNTCLGFSMTYLLTAFDVIHSKVHWGRN